MSFGLYSIVFKYISELCFSFSFNLDQRGTQSPLFHCMKTSQVISASKNTLLPKMEFGLDRASVLPTGLLKQHSRSHPSLKYYTNLDINGETTLALGN